MTLYKSIILYTASILLFSGCVRTPTPKEETKIDATLPIVTLTQHGTVVGMKAIGFEWKSLNDPRVQGIYIYKASPNGEKGLGSLEYYTTIKGRFSTHYLDRDVQPGTTYNYSFKTFSKDAEGKSSKLIIVTSKKVLPSVSWIHAQTGMPRSAKILWRPHNNEIVESYIIERSTLEDEEWEKLATVEGRLSAEYIDRGLKDNYVYKYRILAKTYNGIISTPSATVKVVTKALPLGVSNIQASNNLAKKIKVTWTPTTAKDFDLYYVYRADKLDGTYKLVATLHNPVYVDEDIKKDGKSYFYRVAVVDKDGLESEHDAVSVQGMSLVKLNPPAIFNASLDGHKIEIVWGRSDPRTKSYIIRRTEKQGWFDTKVEEYKNLTKKRFIDNHIVDNATYTYVIYAVDVNGIVSEPSIAIKLKTQESDKIIDPQQAPVDANPNAGKVSSKQSGGSSVVAPTEDLDMSGL